jgi:ribosomal protein L29
MKKKDFKDLNAKETKDLVKMVVAKKDDLAKIIPNLKAGKEKNLKKSKNLKKEIAQLLTLIQEKEVMKKETAKQ